MELPKFLLGDNTDYPTAIFVVHTEYPRFIIRHPDGTAINADTQQNMC